MLHSPRLLDEGTEGFRGGLRPTATEFQYGLDYHTLIRSRGWVNSLFNSNFELLLVPHLNSDRKKSVYTMASQRSLHVGAMVEGEPISYDECLRFG